MTKLTTACQSLVISAGLAAVSLAGAAPKESPDVSADSYAWLEDVTLGIERIVTSTQLETVKEYAGVPL